VIDRCPGYAQPMEDKNESVESYDSLWNSSRGYQNGSCD
jgi:hypothetical protein